MTSANQHPTSIPYWQVPTLEKKHHLLGGVAAGIANEIGVEALLVRAGFLTLFAANGVGILLYATIWIILTIREFRTTTPPSVPSPKTTTQAQRNIGFICIVIGIVGVTTTIFRGLWFPFWPVGLLALGFLTIRHSYTNQKTANYHSTKRKTQLLIGILLGIAGTLLLINEVTPSGGWKSLTPSLLVLAGIFIVVAPWSWRILLDFDQERQIRITADMQADISAHLHDSVLQTLLLIQRSNTDPQKVAQLARRQERELRNWLEDGRSSRIGESIRGWLDTLVDDIEMLYNVSVETVVVGDKILNKRIVALLHACKEATVNAAKHSEAPTIALYVEITNEQIEIFIRDKGKGFDLTTIPSDRRGISESIKGRMRRVHGSATLHSSSNGTEVELYLPLSEGV